MNSQQPILFERPAIAPALPDAARGALELWRRLRGTRPLPQRSDFKPIEWRAWMSDISLVELHDSTPRYFVAVHGGRTGQYTGGCLHKKYLDDCLTDGTRDLCLALYQESERTGLPTFSVLTPQLRDGTDYTLWRLALPFSKDQSESGSGIVDRFVIWAGTDSHQPYDFEWFYKSLQANIEEYGDITGQATLSVLEG